MSVNRASLPFILRTTHTPDSKEPVLRVAPGETVLIQTLTHAGATQDQEPISYLTGMGVPREEILDDVLSFWADRDGRLREGASGHVITGPLYIEGASPGDMLEIEILDVTTRVPWGINNTSARGGVFSAQYPGFAVGDQELDIAPGTHHLIRTGLSGGREVALFSPTIEVPLAPFMGIMAVAPDPVVGEPGVTVPGVQSSRLPGTFGGNLDVKDSGPGRHSTSRSSTKAHSSMSATDMALRATARSAGRPSSSRSAGSSVLPCIPAAPRPRRAPSATRTT